MAATSTSSPVDRGRYRRMRRHAAELVALAPDVILASGGYRRRGVTRGEPHHADRVPVTADPVGAGYVESLAWPGGNATGFTGYEYGLAANGWSCSKRSHRA